MEASCSEGWFLRESNQVCAWQVVGYKHPSLYFHTSTTYPSFKAKAVISISTSAILLSPQVAQCYMAQVTEPSFYPDVSDTVLFPFLSAHSLFSTPPQSLNEYLLNTYRNNTLSFLCFSLSQLWSDCISNYLCSTLMVPSTSFCNYFITMPHPLVDSKHLWGNYCV